MTKEFGAIFDLCMFVFDMYQASAASLNPSLVKATLRTLSVFLSWAPLGFVFETPLLQKLVDCFLPQSAYRTEAIRCLTEVAEISSEGSSNPGYQERVLMLFIEVVQKVEAMVQDKDLAAEYVKLGDPRLQEGYETFCQSLAAMLEGFVRNGVAFMKATCKREGVRPDLVSTLVSRLRRALLMLLQISSLPGEELFRACADFWNFLVSHIYSTFATEAIERFLDMSGECKMLYVV